MKRPSLRWMILFPVLGTVASGFFVFGVYIDRVEQISRIADVDSELVRAEQATPPGLPTQGEPNQPSTGQPPTGQPPIDVANSAGAPDLAETERPVELTVDSDGNLVTSTGAPNPFSPETLRALAQSTGSKSLDDPNYRVRVTERAGGLTLVTALSLGPIDAAVSDFRLALAVGALVILIVVAGVVWLLTTMLIRPVTRMANTATRIAFGELDTAIADPRGSREMVDLAADLEQMLTRLRSTLDASEQSAAEATAARDDMKRFLADMSHELRTPLTALKGYSDLYAGGMLAEQSDVDRAMSRIGSESERLHRLANDMLQLARDGETDQKPERHDVAAVAASVVDDLRAAYPEQRLRFSSTAPSSPFVDAVPGRIHQAILNLGANACQLSEPGGEVAIAVESTGSEAIISVIDHGPGIDSADAEHIFLPFYRAESSRSRMESGRGGAGLGLALVQQIAERHGGAVRVSPTPGGGATFTLTFPLTTPMAGSHAPDESAT